MRRALAPAVQLADSGGQNEKARFRVSLPGCETGRGKRAERGRVLIPAPIISEIEAL
jgi:hypothetical protein